MNYSIEENKNVIKLNPIEYVLYDYRKKERISSIGEAVSCITSITKASNAFVFVVISSLLHYTDISKLNKLDNLMTQRQPIDIIHENWGGFEYKQKFADMIEHAMHLNGADITPSGMYGVIKEHIDGIDFNAEELNEPTTEFYAIKTVAHILECWFDGDAKELDGYLDNSSYELGLPYDIERLICSIKDEVLYLHRFGALSIAEHLDINWEIVIDYIVEAKIECASKKSIIAE